MAGKFEISKRKNGEFQFNLKAGNGQVIATGGHLVTFDRGFRRLLGRGQLTLLSGTS